MRRYLIISALCLFGISDAWAWGMTANDTSLCYNKTCNDLGYTLSNVVATSKCNGVYFTCPVAHTENKCIKCDNIATVGDVKFSNRSGCDMSSATTVARTCDHYGWLLADGRSILSSTNYPDLYELLNSSTIPNLSGRFLRGTGTSSISSRYVGVAGPKSYQMAKHQHSVTAYYYSTYYNKDQKSGSNEQFRFLSTYTLGGTDAQGSTTHGVCPVKYTLYAFIYAGRKN